MSVQYDTPIWRAVSRRLSPIASASTISTRLRSRVSQRRRRRGRCGGATTSACVSAVWPSLMLSASIVIRQAPMAVHHIGAVGAHRPAAGRTRRDSIDRLTRPTGTAALLPRRPAAITPDLRDDHRVDAVADVVDIPTEEDTMVRQPFPLRGIPAGGLGRLGVAHALSLLSARPAVAPPGPAAAPGVGGSPAGR